MKKISILTIVIITLLAINLATALHAHANTINDALTIKVLEDINNHNGQQIVQCHQCCHHNHNSNLFFSDISSLSISKVAAIYNNNYQETYPCELIYPPSRPPKA